MAKRFFTFVLCVALACSLVFSAAGYDRVTRSRLILKPTAYFERLRCCWEVAPVVDVGGDDEPLDLSDEAVAAEAEKHMIEKERYELFEYTETDPALPESGGSTSGGSGGVVPLSLVTLSNGEVLDLSTAVGRCAYYTTFDKVTLKVPSFWTSEMDNVQNDTTLGAIWQGFKNVANFFSNLVRFLWNLRVTFTMFFITLYNAAVYVSARVRLVLTELLSRFVVKFNEACRKRVNWSYLGASLIPIDWGLLYEENKIGEGTGKIKIPFVVNPRKYVDSVGGHRGGR